MAGQVKEAKIGNRTQRGRLPARKSPYFRLLGDGLHLGYYRGGVPGRAGTWIARRYAGERHYETVTLGIADDLPDVPADGKKVLTFEQAHLAARRWARDEAAKQRAAAGIGTAPITVRRAVEDYIAARKRKDPVAGRDTEIRLSHHVMGAAIADVALVSLTDADLAGWRASLRRGGRARKPGTEPLSAATEARVCADLRAALNAAARATKVPPDIVGIIREGLRRPPNADRPRAAQILPDADVRRLVAAAFDVGADFGALVMMLATTGARMRQVAALTVADVQTENARVMMPLSKKGRGEKAKTHVPLPLPDDAMTRLRPLLAGRAGHETLLLRWHHRQVPGDTASGRLPSWERADRRPWRNPSDLTRAWRAALEAAGLPKGLVPYCLRHSSIVRMLRAGVPVRMVAAAHDTSVSMIEKHYSAYIIEADESLLRQAAVSLAPAQPTPLRAMQ
jgi:integrase